MLVLIADDDHDLCYALARRCQALRLETQIATSATDALLMMEKQPPDLVILDVAMPNGSGLAVCEMMSHHERLKNLPVVMLTGKKDSQTIQRCHEMCAYYVTKCDDVWGRLHPLLTSLLELNFEAPSLEKDEAPARAKQFEKDDVEPDVVDQQDQNGHAGSTSESILDAVFAMLGANDDAMPFEEGGSVDGAGRPWVLCIDDDEDFVKVLKIRFEEHGIAVLQAFAGRDGVRTAVTNQAHAIILDYQLPDGNGAYVLRRLKENPITRDIPVIVMTGLRDRHIERQVASLGAACLMTKPYDWPKLLSTVQQFLPEAMIGASR